MKKLALFDFDGTLTSNDTLIEFLKFYVGDSRFYFGMTLLSPFLMAYKLKVMKNWVAKEKVLTYFLKGEPIGTFLSRGKEFALTKVPDMIKQEAQERLDWHKAQDHRVIVVSASAAGWIEAWTEKEGIELISTILELKEGNLTGKIKGKNCYGPEKEKRIREILNPSDYSQIYAYGDSRGDREMLALASDPFFRKYH